jgi:formate/nitrite transporter FocA (FNT family)
MSLLDSIRKFENMHIVLWLMKDICWITDFKIGGMIMIVPTLALAMYLTWRLRFYRTELFTNAAVCAWICANSIWMTGEFFFDDTLRPFAVVFFVVGFLLIGTEYFLKAFSKQTELMPSEEVTK